jgi:hypothetical protein
MLGVLAKEVSDSDCHRARLPHRTATELVMAVACRLEENDWIREHDHIVGFTRRYEVASKEEGLTLRISAHLSREGRTAS